MDLNNFWLAQLLAHCEVIRSDMAELKRNAAVTKRDVKRLLNRKPEISVTERITKLFLTLSVPALTFWATGSAEKAVDALRAMLTR